MGILEKRGARLIVHLPRELDHHYTEEVRRRVDAALRMEAISELEFDFSGTVFMDSAGIGLLLGRAQMMRALSGRVLVSHMNEQIGRILALSGIERHIRLEKEEQNEK
ncbi:MAG: anti-sigma factor antagonist [Lachnospiraceae bacterium]|nr:anti-sigma factor antagonist [Lachnospiraceae bacterium]